MKETTYKQAKVTVQTYATTLRSNQPRRTLTTLVKDPNMMGRGAQFVITEQSYVPRPERQWETNGRTVHLTLKSNATHVQIQGYIRREDIVNNRELADLLAREVEQMGEQIEEMKGLGHE